MEANQADKPRGGAEAAARPGWTRAGSPRIRILIVDDHAMVREGFRRLLEQRTEVEVVGDASNGREAVTEAERLQPDVVLMDMAMDRLNGLDATSQIRKRCPKTRVLMVAANVEEDNIVAALRHGASGYVAKRMDMEELVLGIQAVHRGNTYFSSDISDGDSVNQYMWQANNEDSRTGYQRLTSREREVLQLIAEGNSNQDIAKELFISVKTVEAHKAHIMSKLPARNRTDLILYAIRKGLIGTDTPLDVQADEQTAEAG